MRTSIKNKCIQDELKMEIESEERPVRVARDSVPRSIEELYERVALWGRMTALNLKIARKANNAEHARVFGSALRYLCMVAATPKILERDPHIVSDINGLYLSLLLSKIPPNRRAPFREFVNGSPEVFWGVYRYYPDRIPYHEPEKWINAWILRSKENRARSEQLENCNMVIVFGAMYHDLATEDWAMRRPEAERRKHTFFALMYPLFGFEYQEMYKDIVERITREHTPAQKKRAYRSMFGPKLAMCDMQKEPPGEPKEPVFLN